MKRNHRPPLLVRMMLPRAEGLELNPLYLRLSGKAYPRARRWPRPALASEFRDGRLSSWIGLATPLALLIGGSVASHQSAARMGYGSGWLALLSFVSACFAVAGLFLLALHTFHGGAEPVIERFLRNSSANSWGPAICLTSLGGWEIDAAVLGALIGRSVGDAIALTLEFIGVPILAWLGILLLEGADLAAFARARTWVVVGTFLPAIVAVAWMMSVLDLALAAEAAWMWAIAAKDRPNQETQRASSWLPLAIHLPGGVLLFGVAVACQYQPLVSLTESWSARTFIMLGVYLFVLPNVWVGYHAAKSRIAAGWGRIGQAMEMLARAESIHKA